MMIEPATAMLAFTLGLFSTLHCLGMFGGIASALACSLPQAVGQMPVGRNGFVLLFSLGRISVYGLLGIRHRTAARRRSGCSIYPRPNP